jgi:hypothetical protein
MPGNVIMNANGMRKNISDYAFNPIQSAFLYSLLCHKQPPIITGSLQVLPFCTLA